MTDEHFDSSTYFENGSSFGASFEARWSRLEPDEQRLALMAIDAMTAGEFNSSHSWERFVDAAIELLPALADAVVSVEELHALALEASRVDTPE
jgi:hypothetical protein